MRPTKNQKKGKPQQRSKEWEDWQRYVQKEKQRLLHKSGKRVVELNLNEPEPLSAVYDDLPDEDEPDVHLDIHKGRRPPVPGVSREEAIQVNDDQIGRTVRPFTVNDYRNIKPLASVDYFEGESVAEETYAVIQEPEIETLDVVSVEESTEPVKFDLVPDTPKVEENLIPEPEPVKIEKEKPQRGRKKKVQEPPGDELQLFSGNIADHQALSRQRLTRKTRIEREELIEKLLDPVISLDEAATLIGVCKTTVRRYTNKGELECLRTPGDQRRFKLSQVLEFVKRREEEERLRQGTNRK